METTPCCAFARVALPSPKVSFDIVEAVAIALSASNALAHSSKVSFVTGVPVSRIAFNRSSASSSSRFFAFSSASSPNKSSSSCSVVMRVRRRSHSFACSTTSYIIGAPKSSRRAFDRTISVTARHSFSFIFLTDRHLSRGISFGYSLVCAKTTPNRAFARSGSTPSVFAASLASSPMPSGETTIS